MALPDAPVPTAPATLTSVLFDKAVKTTTPNNVAKTQGIQPYTVTVHDNQYQYSYPLCATATLVGVNSSNTIDINTFVAGDTAVVSVQPDPATPAKACMSRIVRQQVSKGPSSGECLQNFQVKEEIEGSPAPLLVGQEYTYLLRIYSRPTVDCDGNAYGASPITTVVAAGKPFAVWLVRGSGTNPLMTWSLTTDTAGRASLSYTFTAPASDYKFQIMPGGNNSPGDVISWGAKVLDPNPSPSSTPGPSTSRPAAISIWPVIVVLALMLGVAGGMEYRHRLLKAREHELPEEEYQRVSKL